MKAGGPPDLMATELGRLCERYGLGGRQRAQLEAILSALASNEYAPTAVRDPARSLEVHLADSLVALELDALRTAERIVDLGSGAGFPGLTLAVALPGGELRLVEAQARKCAFMEGLCATAGIANAQVICTRVEDWAEGIGANDVVLARAVAAISVVLEYAAPVLRVGGTLVDWRGRREPTAERSAHGAAQRLGLELAEVRHVEPYEGARDHHLHVYVKVRETPDGFPRRAGMARKRPLGHPSDRDRR